MILSNEIVIDAPINRVWGLLDHVESVVSCIPGATYIGRDGDDYKASMKIKVGAIAANFDGRFRFTEKNEAERSIQLKGGGKDTRGKASATGVMSVKLEPISPNRTKASVKIDLAMTGPLAQFGGSIITDIAKRIVEQFSDNLNAAVTTEPAEQDQDSEQPAPVSKSEAAPKEPAAALELGGVLAKHGVAYGAGIVGVAAVVWLLVRLL